MPIIPITVTREHRHILGVAPDELAGWLNAAGQPAYRLGQILDWTYVRRVESFDAMTNLPAALRAAQLDALSPLKVLERGYAVARDEDGRVLKHASDFSAGFDFRLTVSDGDIAARAVEQQPKEGGA